MSNLDPGRAAAEWLAKAAKHYEEAIERTSNPVDLGQLAAAIAHGHAMLRVGEHVVYACDQIVGV